MFQALEGLKVADFSWAMAAPLLSEFLAQHGAAVVRVESVGRPCIVRSAAPYKDGVAGVNRSGYFNYFNADKYGMALDLKHPQAVEVIKKLVKWSDVVIESFTPGVMESLGLGYEQLREVKPDVILFSTSIHGETGAYSSHPGAGVQIVGWAGFTNITGYTDRMPTQPFGAYTDVLAPRLGAALLLASLDRLRRTGKGEWLDLSQMEASLHFLSPYILDYVVNEREASRTGNRHAYAAPHGVYRCRGSDRWCAIAVFNNYEWQNICQVLGDTSWSKDKRFVTLLGRKKNEDELDRLIEAWTINLEAKEAMSRIQATGVAAGVVQNARNICEDPALRMRKHHYYLEHSEMGNYPHSGALFRLSKTPGKLEKASPRLGEHTEFVCTKLLSMTDEEFVALLAAGVFT
ncbi:MAG: CoA transferase [Chloroflexota bacterium]|nr:CoA transferase [Chloroflexota bacterium]